MAILVLLFIVVPLAELFVIIQVGQSVGVLWTIFLLLAISIVGAWMVKFQGLGVFMSARRKMMSGQMPSDELIAGIAILVAGALMLTPGFITDGVGLLLLLPPVRAVLIRSVRRRFDLRVQTFGTPGGPPNGGPAGGTGPIDTDGWDSP